MHSYLEKWTALQEAVYEVRECNRFAVLDAAFVTSLGGGRLISLLWGAGAVLV